MEKQIQEVLTILKTKIRETREQYPDARLIIEPSFNIRALVPEEPEKKNKKIGF